MMEYVNNNRTSVFSGAIVTGLFAATAIIALFFNDVTPASLMFM